MKNLEEERKEMGERQYNGSFQDKINNDHVGTRDVSPKLNLINYRNKRKQTWLAQSLFQVDSNSFCQRFADFLGAAAQEI